MVDIRNSPTSALAAPALPEQEVRKHLPAAVDEPSRDQCADSEQLMLVVQQLLLPVLPAAPLLAALTTCSSAGGKLPAQQATAGAAHNSGVHMPAQYAAISARALAQSGALAAAALPLATTPSVHALPVSSVAGLPASGLTQTDMVAAAPTGESASPTGTVPGVLPGVQSVLQPVLPSALPTILPPPDAAKLTDLQRKTSAVSDDSDVHSRPTPTESPTRTETATVRAELPSPPRASAQDLHAAATAGVPEHSSKDEWVYTFNSWGTQHAVKISHQPGASQPQLALQPSTELVEQRLHAHASPPSAQWDLRDYRDGQQQRQQHQRDDVEEEP